MMTYDGVQGYWAVCVCVCWLEPAQRPAELARHLRLQRLKHPDVALARQALLLCGPDRAIERFRVMILAERKLW